MVLWVCYVVSVFACAFSGHKMWPVLEGLLDYTTMYDDELFDQGLTG
jgi:hypothetical protein